MILKKECKHLKCIILGSDRIYHTHCPECNKEVIVQNVVLNLLREILKKEGN